MRSRVLLIMGLCVILIGSTLAAQAEPSSPRDRGLVELTYTPLNISDSAGLIKGSGMSTINLKAEGRVYQYVTIGVELSRGSGGSLSGGVLGLNDADYSDTDIYVKIPFNAGDFSDSARTKGPRPASSSFYGYTGYKFNKLTGTQRLTGQSVTVEEANGFGFGFGVDARLDYVSPYAEILYFPSMSFKGAGGGDLRVWTYDLGLRTNFGMDIPIEACLGYHWENHDGSNNSIKYDGAKLGITARF